MTTDDLRRQTDAAVINMLQTVPALTSQVQNLHEAIVRLEKKVDYMNGVKADIKWLTWGFRSLAAGIGGLFLWALGVLKN